MADFEPAYLRKFRQALVVALAELPNDKEVIQGLIEALMEDRRLIRDYQLRCRRLELENYYLLRGLKPPVAAAAE